jgi:hypothetical protein
MKQTDAAKRRRGDAAKKSLKTIRVRLAIVIKTDMDYEAVSSVLGSIDPRPEFLANLLQKSVFVDWCLRNRGELREWMVEDLTDQVPE